MEDVYRDHYLIETAFIVTNIETAELIKNASNSFLATKISFMNGIANLCEKVGADGHMVARGRGLDGRIGRKFLHPGPGFGGSCFPKDTRALLQIADKHKVELGVIKSAVVANERQKDIIVRKISETIEGIKGKKIGVLGLSFKPNTNDMREAPSVNIIKILLDKGASVAVFDPVAMDDARELLPSVKYCKDAYEAMKGVDAGLLITEWNQFRNLDLKKIRDNMKKPYFFDLRNVYEPGMMKELGFEYFGIGRK